MKIYKHPKFNRSFKQRVRKNTKLIRKFQQRLEVFTIDPKNPILKDHTLKGAMRKYRSFSVTGDTRVIYLRKSSNQIILYDIGTHNQVY